MSTEKNVYEALRWLRTAEGDLDAATLLGKNNKFPHACFFAQQAGEKALKAVWYYADADPWGHSIRKLIEDLENVDLDLYDRVKGLLRPGTILDRFYIPTRYPNGLVEGTPHKAFTRSQAERAMKAAEAVLEAVRKALEL